MTDTPEEPPTLDAGMRDFVRKPAVWFHCAIDLSVLLPSMGEEIDRTLEPLGADRAAYEALDLQRLIGLTRAFTLLAGYAAENYLKGLWIARKKGSADDVSVGEAFLPNRVTRHDLNAIASEAGISLTEQERAVLNNLESAIVWRAKYPTPKRVAEYRLCASGPGTVENIRNLLAHLEALARECAEKQATAAKTDVG